jgi:hypothetical protein
MPTFSLSGSVQEHFNTELQAKTQEQALEQAKQILGVSKVRVNQRRTGDVSGVYYTSYKVTSTGDVFMITQYPTIDEVKSKVMTATLDDIIG